MNKRLFNELKTIRQEIKTNKCPYVESIDLKDNNILIWKAIMKGPEDTPFENGKFELELTFPDDFPYKPPRVYFKTKVYHPNVADNGNICLDLLKDNWSPILSISKLLLSINSLMAYPNPDDPLNGTIAKQYKTDRELYNETVKEWIKLYSL
jgi:ubiquitin-conjugating enzyme E2 D/E